jgi:hypothetical protein
MYKPLPERDVLINEIKCFIVENGGELPGSKKIAIKLGYSEKNLRVNRQELRSSILN